MITTTRRAAKRSPRAFTDGPTVEGVSFVRSTRGSDFIALVTGDMPIKP
jgi:hypothetical protein